MRRAFDNYYAVRQDHQPSAAFPPAAISVFQFTILLSTLFFQSLYQIFKMLLASNHYPFLYQFTFPYIHRIVLEHLFQPFMYLLFRNPFLQHHLEESASTGAADQPSGDHWLNGREDLIDQGVGAPCVHFFAQLPVMLQKLREGIGFR